MLDPDPYAPPNPATPEHRGHATGRQWVIALLVTASWLIGPTIGYMLNGVFPRDPAEPQKLTIGAAATAGMIVFGFLGLSAIAGLYTVISQWRTTRWAFKVLLALPIILLLALWFGLIAEGM